MTWFTSFRPRFGRLTNLKSGDGAKRLTERENWIMNMFQFLKLHIVRQKKPRTLGMLQHLPQTMWMTPLPAVRRTPPQPSPCLRGRRSRGSLLVLQHPQHPHHTEPWSRSLQLREGAPQPGWGFWMWSRIRSYSIGAPPGCHGQGLCGAGPGRFQHPTEDGTDGNPPPVSQLPMRRESPSPVRTSCCMPTGKLAFRRPNPNPRHSSILRQNPSDVPGDSGNHPASTHADPAQAASFVLPPKPGGSIAVIAAAAAISKTPWHFLPPNASHTDTFAVIRPLTVGLTVLGTPASA
ncbi:hypothetical protein GWK47_043780 [Chionoecetes opilio]|uniref:Uncharacterized protein n=1 Tax=Chionoecetes opilio TaxID=41210 RepID=A0A8J4YER2_CHIOP|nr:hypothetical protein GWK47_043780 [Chionoecetes opilio]